MPQATARSTQPVTQSKHLLRVKSRWSPRSLKPNLHMLSHILGILLVRLVIFLCGPPFFLLFLERRLGELASFSSKAPAVCWLFLPSEQKYLALIFRASPRKPGCSRFTLPILRLFPDPSTRYYKAQTGSTLLALGVETPLPPFWTSSASCPHTAPQLFVRSGLPRAASSQDLTCTSF